MTYWGRADMTEGKRKGVILMAKRRMRTLLSFEDGLHTELIRLRIVRIIEQPGDPKQSLVELVGEIEGRILPSLRVAAVRERKSWERHSQPLRLAA